jgi:carbon storage regulator
MLVLTRKANERIVIGDDIRITVAAVRGNVVRIGVEAPPQTTILREELLPVGQRPEAVGETPQRTPGSSLLQRPRPLVNPPSIGHHIPDAR